MGATVEIVSFTFLLFVLYLIEGIFIGLQLGRIYYFRHKLKSFQVGFLVQLFVWVVLRSAFFLLVDFLDNISSTLLYWIPVNIQFSTFSLLVVYYAHLYYARKAEWKDFKRKYLTVWVTVNVALAILAGVWIGFGISEGTDPDWLVEAHAIFTGAIFFVLVCVLAWYGYKLVRQLKDNPHQAQTKLLARVSFRKILFITVSLFILFTSRCIYNFASATGRVSFSITSGQTLKDFVMFLFFTAWEVIPTVLVLILFGAVHSTTLGAFSRRDYFPGRHRNVQVQKAHANDEPVLTTTNSGNLVKAELFNDPKRYDSDDDDDDLDYQYGYGKYSSESDKLLSPKHALNGGSGRL